MSIFLQLWWLRTWLNCHFFDCHENQNETTLRGFGFLCAMYPIRCDHCRQYFYPPQEDA